MRLIAERLQAGEVVRVAVHGHSMEPRIRSGATVTLDPSIPTEVGAAVLAKVRGRFYVHLVAARDGDRFLITNLKGRPNGWTRQVYGTVTRVEP